MKKAYIRSISKEHNELFGCSNAVKAGYTKDRRLSILVAVLLLTSAVLGAVLYQSSSELTTKRVEVRR